MPIYEYVCEACAFELEAIQKMSDAALVECPECGKPALRKKVSAAGFRLSGGGWYETDFKSGNKKNIAGEQKTSPAKSEPSKPDSSQSAAKPAAKASASSKS